MNIFNVRDFGAVGDGKTLDTASIQAAIEKASSEGGTVYFPKGEYRTGTLFLKSDITINVSSKAKILGSQNINDYSEEIVGCIEAPSFNNVLFYAENAEFITFTGGGTIDGNGASFEPIAGFPKRPMLMRFINCNNIKFDGIILKDSASWCCHMISCKDVVITNTKLFNHANRNNDGFDLDSCENVFISNTHIVSIDDSICLKSTTDKPCKNIVITNCILSSETATFKLGTSSKAGFRDITISNCVFYNCPMGTIKLICVDGGILENINIDNIVMNDVGSPLFIRVGKRNLTFEKPAENDFWGKGQANGDYVGMIRNISVTNIRANVTVAEKDKTPMMITGLKDSLIKNVFLSNIDITFPGGGTKEDGERMVEEDPFRYPEQWFFGVLPAYALFARHVEDLKMENIRFSLSGNEERKAVVLENVVKI